MQALLTIKARPNIGYVIIREDLHSPIIQTQVIDILKRLSGLSKFGLHLIWFYRVDYLWRFRSVTNSAIERLRNEGIKVVRIPFIAGRFPIRWYMVPFVLPQWLLGLGWAKLRHGVEVLHCRSYHAGLAAACFNLISRTPFIFDPRSPFPEEHVAAGTWKRDSLDYAIWKTVENWLVRRSTVTIATSSAFARVLSAPNVHSRVVVIPNNVSLSFRTSTARSFSLDFGQSSLALCYVGSLGHWNKASTYVNFIQLVQNICEGVKFLFVIPQQAISELKAALHDAGLDNGTVFVTSLPHNEVSNTIATCTAGLQLMEHYDVRLSIKVVEYLAAGLPVLVSENVAGAAEIVRTLKVGFVLRPDWKNLPEAISFLREVQANRDSWRERCLNVARVHFSTESVARRLADVYDELSTTSTKETVGRRGRK